MASNGIQLPVLNWSYKDQSISYNEWKDFMESYFVIQGVEEKKKWHYLLLSAGSKGRELWETWKISLSDREDSTKVFKKFKDHLIGTPNKWVSRLDLASLHQNEHESIDDFVCRLKAKAALCMFGNDDDDHLTFQLIRGIRSNEIRRKLVSKGNDLKFVSAYSCALECEATVQNTSSFSRPNQQIDSFKKYSEKLCHYCGSSHQPRKCPAYGKKCSHCQKMNHFAKMCKTKENENDKQKQRSSSVSKQRAEKTQELHAMDKRDDVTDDYDDYFDCGTIMIDSIDNHEHTRHSIIAKIDVKAPKVTQKVILKAKADTGANGSILPIRCLKKMYPDAEDRSTVIQPSSAILTAVNGSTMKQYGTLKMQVKFDDSSWITCKFFVCETNGPAILSCDVSEKLGIVSVSNSSNISSMKQTTPDEPIPDVTALQKLYPERFEGLGNLPGPYSIELKTDAEPVVAPPRKYPIQLKDEICKTLQEMEKMKVIMKCDDDEASEWVNQLAFSRKSSGELRICLDPKHLNKAIKRTYYKTPTIDEISHKLAKSTVYSKMDAKHGYWGIHLTEDSSKLCTFQSPAGKYRFLRLPFGLKVSQDVFQSKMDRILQDAGEGIVGIADDVIVFGRTEQEHDAALHRLMKAATNHRLIFRLEKSAIRQTSINFFGLIWSQKGMQPDPKKCDNIRSKKSPVNAQELLSFLGLIQYLSPFIPHLASRTKLLRQLLKKDTPWEWNAEYEQAFDDLKNAINKDMMINYFDPSIPVNIEVDASLSGLGAALVQNNKPVAFASKSLLPAETRYANIERELLAVVFGLEHFHCFIYGKPVLVYSDHRPLEAIYKKQLSSAPPRLQRMLLRIQPYDVTIEYKPGKDLIYADYLSRISPTQGQMIELEHTIHTIQISEKQLEIVRDATAKDQQLSALREQVIRGWPEKATDAPKIIRNFFSMRDCISVEDGVLFVGQRMIIPEQLKSEYLERIHTGHLGITKCQLRAKDSIYWPGMSTDIEKYVKECIFCLQNSRSQSAEPMMAHELPTQPWEILSSDLFELEGKTFLLIADHFSKMPFVKLLRSTVSDDIIQYFKELFSVHGIPKRVFTDNGPQYASRQWSEFAENWEFEHVTSSPRYPQSNGFAERMVGVVKQILKKAKESGMEARKALLAYRATPITTHLPSPAELLFKRKIKTNLPTRNLPDRASYEYRQIMERDKENNETSYNEKMHVKPLSDLLPGMQVLAQIHGKRWEPATVNEKLIEPRSYTIETPEGRTFRRNRKYIKPIPVNAAEKMSTQRVTFGIPEDDDDEAEVDHEAPTLRRSTRLTRKPDRLSY